jgi:hypothetical protein
MRFDSAREVGILAEPCNAAQPWRLLIVFTLQEGCHTAGFVEPATPSSALSYGVERRLSAILKTTPVISVLPNATNIIIADGAGVVDFLLKLDIQRRLGK